MARIMITIPDTLLTEIDQAAQTEHRSRSELLREAVRYYLRIQPVTVATQSASVKKSLGMIEQLRLKAQMRAQQATDSTEIIRSFRGEIAIPQASKGE